MSEQQVPGGFPRRDAQGRIVSVRDLLGISLAGLVVGVLVLILFDWAAALIGVGSFGWANGWLAVILPAWLFLEEFRAWPVTLTRTVVALIGALASVVGGLLVAGLAVGLPPLVTGVLAAATFTVLYALIWFYGMHGLAARDG